MAAALYLFLTAPCHLPNRKLTRGSRSVRLFQQENPDMSDIVFLMLGGGTLLVLAFYARVLDRL